MVKSFHGQQRQNMITRALICEAALAPPSLFSLVVIHIQHALFSIPVSEQARALPDTFTHGQTRLTRKPPQNL